MREHSLSVVAPEKLGEGLISVKEGAEIEEDVRLESVHEGILVTADVSTTATGVCGRCLTDIAQRVEVEFQELFAYSSEEASEHEVHDDHVDLEPLVRDAVVLSLPFQPVCRPDCPGLDPETGERLADHPEREPREVLDPRWEALARFSSSPGTEDSSASDREER
ncbi:YceD family protein [Paramicrobacterium sp. CJ85]|uniref:YceD family protein n=1 Tax=Paramicrobacterium sp. CJ85 TaxID=3445355 RepID=UPI003F61FF35